MRTSLYYGEMALVVVLPGRPRSVPSVKIVTFLNKINIKSIRFLTGAAYSYYILIIFLYSYYILIIFLLYSYINAIESRKSHQSVNLYYVWT